MSFGSSLPSSTARLLVATAMHRRDRYPSWMVDRVDKVLMMMMMMRMMRMMMRRRMMRMRRRSLSER